MPGFDPIELSKRTYQGVAQIKDGVEERRYYRFRGGKWYGGIATGDVVGCNLRCKFCWSWRYSYYVGKGRFYSPQKVFEKLYYIASRRGYKYVRLSGGEPSISMKHLLTLLECFEETKLYFILETNGILIGYYKEYAQQLASYKHLIVRVSFKGTSPEEFEKLTGAKREFFEYQFKALENLIDYGMPPGRQVYPAVILSFSEEENIQGFINRLREIHPILPESIDPEYVILYPHVVELLRKNKLYPKKAFRPDNLPDFMI